MKVNIYYGGRGLIEDPTIYVINVITEVLEELRVEVNRYNLFEEKQGITRLPNTIKEADGIILATTVEWLGIGGFMQEFLDACWFYGDKDKIKQTYMLPVVMANTYGERDGEFALVKAWEVLGGKAIPGLCSYVDDYMEFEANKDFKKIIEAQAELLYRFINQKRNVLPNSNNVVKQNLLTTGTIELTPQESEQLSVYASDETYVKKQKEDLEELKMLFKEMLGDSSDEEQFVQAFKQNFNPEEGFSASYAIRIEDQDKSLIIDVNGSNLVCEYGNRDDVDVTAKATSEVLKRIINGDTNFQKSFMSGEVSAKGNFKLLKMIDSIFTF
ncbi:hypothetical protein lbkm_3255 [Lachnospiraceae bacterium KM106-2]|nr:hypothetical protein lbkm_3255 [Lachnospiraceae bacterium KM106-2]